MKVAQTMTAPQDDIEDLLAAYALDALEPEEIARLHTLLEERPELRATLAELRSTADKLPYGLPEAAPPPELRQRALDYATGRAARTPTRRPGGMRGWLLALGGLAAAASVAAAIGWGQAIGLRAELARVNSKLISVHEDLSRAQTVIARLQGDGQGAMVRTSDGQTVFVVKLPELQPGRTYQLWRIQGDTPASAGVFNVDPRGYGVLVLDPGQQPQNGETVAVTDEPAPMGSPSPTTHPLIAGEVNT
jgi:anti-sigma-K factor RskA